MPEPPGANLPGWEMDNIVDNEARMENTISREDLRAKRDRKGSSWNLGKSSSTATAITLKTPQRAISGWRGKARDGLRRDDMI
jgi:hypothetical protein